MFELSLSGMATSGGVFVSGFIFLTKTVGARSITVTLAYCNDVSKKIP